MLNGQDSIFFLANFLLAFYLNHPKIFLKNEMQKNHPGLII